MPNRLYTVKPTTDELSENRSSISMSNSVINKTSTNYDGLVFAVGIDYAWFGYYNNSLVDGPKRIFLGKAPYVYVSEYYQESGVYCGNKSEFYTNGTSSVVKTYSPC